VLVDLPSILTIPKGLSESSNSFLIEAVVFQPDKNKFEELMIAS
jgi:hypothetical protein